MKKISRKAFLKTNGLLLASAVAPVILRSKSKSQAPELDEELMMRLVESNARTVSSALRALDRPQRRQSYRNLTHGFANLSAAYCHSQSPYRKSSEVLSALELTINKLLRFQYPDGTLDAGGNRKSPPDTGFLLEPLCPAWHVLNKAGSDKLTHVQKQLETFLLNAGEALRTGGVHTPNHRWVVCSALAQLYAIFKDAKYVERIEQWLAEGVYMNADGQYPERSRNYSIVENNAFIHLAEILKRPELYQFVKKNLISTFYYIEENGELVCLDSRRQDQYAPISIVGFYRQYRYMAIHEKNGFFAAITKKITALPNFERRVLSSSLPFFMVSSLLSQKLPAAAKLPDQYTRHMRESHLVRIKRAQYSASIYGGTDKPLIVASGRASNPTFFTFRKGEAILNYARLSTSFFSMGYFRSDGIKSDGETYLLSEQKIGEYYHPLPANKIEEHGDYKHTETLDRRFWSKMDFGSRPATKMPLDFTIRIEEQGAGFLLNFDITGTENVEVTLDLCFRAGGKLQGARQGSKKDDFFLESGYAHYINGNDVITVGPGHFAHENSGRIDGEIYSTHFGSIKGAGVHLYLTGLTPFSHSLTIS